MSKRCSVYEILPAVAQNPVKRVSHVSNNSEEVVNSRQGLKSLKAPFSWTLVLVKHLLRLL